MAYSGGNPNGQTASINSAPVVIANDQTTIKTKLSNDIANTTGTITTATSSVATGALSGVGSATVSITGTYAGVNVTFEGSLDNTNWVSVPAQPIGSVTPVPVIASGVLTANSTNLWNIAPLLGVQYVRVRATAWTSGTANVVIAPSAQFTQPIVSVGSGSISTTPATDGAASGTLAATNANVTTAQLNGASTATIQVTGTWAGTITPQASIDGTNFVNLGATSILNINTGAVSSTIGSGTQSIWQVDIAAFNYFRVVETTYTSGTATVTIRTSTSTGMVALDAPLPVGTNTIGNVNVNTSTFGLNPVATSTAVTAYLNQSLSNTAVLIGTAGNRRLFEYDFYNPNTSGVWVQTFNSATAAGAAFGTNLIRQVYVPPGAGRDWCSPWSNGYGSGIVIACSGSNTSTTAPAGSISVYVGYV